MKEFKRYITILTLLAVILTSLSGCMGHSPFSGSDSSSSSSATPSPTEAESNADAIGMSHNYLLYATENTSLSTVIGVDTFGLLGSAYNDNADRRLSVGEYVGTPVRLSQSSYAQFADWMDGQEVLYAYADLYNMDYALESLSQYENALSAQKTAHADINISTDQIPSAEWIADTIQRNSREFLQTHSGYGQLEEAYITLLADIFTTVLEKYYDAWSQEELSRIYCMLGDVAAVSIDSADFTVNDLKTLYNARVTEEGIIMLDLNQMEALRGDNTLERTLTHEIIHIFQRMRPAHRIEGLTQIGSSQYIEAFDDTQNANSLHYQWLYEACAERMSMDLYEANTPLVYKNMVRYLNTLNLITLLRPECSSDSIEISQLSVNPNGVYELFGATTREERAEIASMLFSICYIQNDREDFVAIYEEKYGSISDQETTIKRVMKQSVAKTMTKHFYKNLAKQLANSSVTLEDVFYLINVFEAALNLHLVYDDASRYELNKDPMEFYLSTQNHFFELVASDSSIPLETLLDSFNQFALVIETDGTYQRNCSFTWLSEKEKAFIYQLLTTNITSLTINIRNLQQSQ